MDNLDYRLIYREDKGAMIRGHLKIKDQSIVFRGEKTGKVITVRKVEIKSIHWQEMAMGKSIRIMMKSGIMHRFSGFPENDQDKLAKFFIKNYEIEMMLRERSLTGWNWGSVSFPGSVMSFDVNEQTAFEIPMGDISQCNTTKNEVSMEFHQNDEAPVSLYEMRFYVPSDPTGVTDPVERFHRKVMAKADVVQATGDGLVSFNDIKFMTPRGHYDITIFQTFIQLHGKTFDYKIPINSVLRLFLLPHQNESEMFFMISVDPPLKQGLTRYHFLILNFSKEEQSNVTLSLSDKELEEKYGCRLLQKEMSGLTFEVISVILKVLTRRKVSVPTSFSGNKEKESIKCCYRTINGLLYPFERSFIFIPKNPLHIRFDEIASVDFERGDNDTRSFDFVIEKTNRTTMVFGNIEKKEYNKLFDFSIKKSFKIRKIGATHGLKGSYNEDIIDSDLEENEPDIYLQRVKLEGQMASMEGNEDQSDSDDQSDDSFIIPEGNESKDFSSESSGDSEKDMSGVEEKDAKNSDSDSNEGDDAIMSDNEDGEEAGAIKAKHKKKESAKKSLKKETAGKRALKKKKDENKPKKSPSAYFLWFSENRNKIKEDNPGISFSEIGKKAGEMWRSLDDKAKWEKEADVKKQKYLEEIAVYRANNPDEIPKKRVKKQKKSSASTTNKGDSLKKKTEYTSEAIVNDSGDDSSIKEDD